MATYFVASGGSNTSPYDTWAKAATSLQTALTAASTNGDIVVIQHDAVPTANKEQSADTTYTFQADVSLISASADDASTAYTPTAMGTENWIGNSTTNTFIRIAGADKNILVWGVTFRLSGSTLDPFQPAYSAGLHSVLDNCYVWGSGTATGSLFQMTGTVGSYCELMNSTLRFGHADQGILVSGKLRCENVTVSSSGTAPALLYTGTTAIGTAEWVGCDLSYVTGTLVGDVTATGNWIFDRCKLGSGVVILAAQTSNPTLGSPEVYVYDCSSGDTHYHFAHYNAVGQTEVSTSIYADDGAEYDVAGTKFSWKIDGSANSNLAHPYLSPPIHLYNETTGSQTPSVEILRNGSTTAYTNGQVWGRFTFKGTSGNPMAEFATDSVAFLGTPANQDTGVGTTGWHDTSVPGNPATAWSGKVDTGSAVTIGEVGTISAQIAVVGAITVYVDPQIRT